MKNESDTYFNNLVEKILKGQGDLAMARGITQNEIEAIYTLAYNLYQQGNYDSARKVFTFLCLHCHLEARFWVALGSCCEQLKQYEDAVKAYSQSALLKHDDPIPPFQAAKCYLALNNIEQARNGLTAAIHWSENKEQHQKTFQKAQALLNTLAKTKPTEKEATL